MKHLLYAVTAALPLLLGSCTATHFGTFTGSTVMIPAEHRYAGSVTGVASASYFLGEGGLMRQGLAAEARANMLSKFPMRDGLILANFTTDIKTSYILCFTKRTLILSADVIDIKHITLPYGLKNGYFLNDTIFFTLPSLETIIADGALNKKQLEYADFSPSLSIGDTYPLFIRGNKSIMGKVVDINFYYGYLCKISIDGKAIYVWKNPSTSLVD